jgi:hypothetical protein
LAFVPDEPDVEAVPENVCECEPAVFVRSTVPEKMPPYAPVGLYEPPVPKVPTFPTDSSCLCPGSVVVVPLYVWLWLTTMASRLPPDAATPYKFPAPTTKRSRKSGVPFAPLHNNHPAGIAACAPLQIMIPPLGIENDASATPKLVLAAAAVDAPVPPFATGTEFTKPSVASRRPVESRLFASCERLNACVMFFLYAGPILANVCWFSKVKLLLKAVTKLYPADVDV